MTRVLMALMLVVLVAGCSIGQRGETTPLALSPRGAHMELSTPTGQLRGELLEVRDNGLVLLSSTEQVTLVEFAAVRRATVENDQRGYRGDDLYSGRVRERLRRTSRFPQGLNSDLEARLLSAYGQSSLVTVRLP